MAIRCIVVGVDGSEGAQRALGWSAELASALDAEVFAVYVVPQSWLIQLDAVQLDTKGFLAETRAKLVGEWTEALRAADVRYSTEFLRGDPATELLGVAHARHADMIVIGGATHGSLRDALLGGTAHRIVNRSPLPVLVVPSAPGGAESDWVPIPG